MEIVEIMNALLGIDHPWAAKITSLLLVLTTIVGSASMIVDALERIAKITPTDKDNLLIGKAKRYLAKAVAFLDRLALNPPKDRARDK